MAKHLICDPATGVSLYHIRDKVDGGNAVAVAANVDGSLDVAFGVFHVTQFIQVRALNDAQTSEWVDFEIPLDPPQNLRVVEE